ncbi:hypothetical protein LguiB_010183 [Lonicera macranthoides]
MNRTRVDRISTEYYKAWYYMVSTKSTTRTYPQTYVPPFRCNKIDCICCGVFIVVAISSTFESIFNMGVDCIRKEPCGGTPTVIGIEPRSMVPSSFSPRLVPLTLFPKPHAEFQIVLGTLLASSLNNMSFELPKINVLQAYYKGINGIYETDFPNEPPFIFNYTANKLSSSMLRPETGTNARVIKYNYNVEIVFQGTNLLNSGENHPLHLHGFSFYVVGSGFRNFDN